MMKPKKTFKGHKKAGLLQRINFCILVRNGSQFANESQLLDQKPTLQLQQHPNISAKHPALNSLIWILSHTNSTNSIEFAIPRSISKCQKESWSG
jgi:hypothetical protein